MEAEASKSADDEWVKQMLETARLQAEAAKAALPAPPTPPAEIVPSFPDLPEFSTKFDDPEGDPVK